MVQLSDLFRFLSLYKRLYSRSFYKLYCSSMRHILKAFLFSCSKIPLLSSLDPGGVGQESVRAHKSTAYCLAAAETVYYLRPRGLELFLVCIVGAAVGM